MASNKNINSPYKKSDPNMFPQRNKNLLYCKLKISIKENTSPVNTIRKAFETVITNLLKIEKNTNINTYSKEQSGKLINHP